MNSMQKGLFTVVLATAFTSLMIIMTGNSSADNQHTEVNKTVDTKIENTETTNTTLNQSMQLTRGKTMNDTEVNHGAARVTDRVKNKLSSDHVRDRVNVAHGVMVPPPPGPFFFNNFIVDGKNDGKVNTSLYVNKEMPVTSVTASTPVTAPKINKNAMAPVLSSKEPIAPAKPSALEMLRAAQKEQPAPPAMMKEFAQQPPVLPNDGPKLVAPVLKKPNLGAEMIQPKPLSKPESLSMPKQLASPETHPLKAPPAPVQNKKTLQNAPQVPSLKAPALNMPIWAGQQPNLRQRPQRPQKMQQQMYRYVPVTPPNYYQYPMMPQQNGYNAPVMPNFPRQGSQLEDKNTQPQKNFDQNRVQ